MNIALISIVALFNFSKGFLLKSFEEDINPILSFIQKETNDVIHYVEPDAFRTSSELISSKGYPVEEYDVMTEDGYILNLIRIPPSGGSNTTCKVPVLMMHGLLVSSDFWVINFPNQSPAFLLADQGYDVWMGNFRGTTYSKKHVSLSTNDKKFWDFSFHEMGIHDLPAIINYILYKTGRENVFYVGHSMGSTAMFALLSEKPEYNKKIKAFMALAPVAFIGNLKSPVRYLIGPISDAIKFGLKLFNQYEFLPNTPLYDLVVSVLCTTHPIRELCSNTLFLFMGYDPAQLNKTRLPVYGYHGPAGTSMKTVLHFSQLVKSKRFCQYDYGTVGNVKRYGQIKPPDYDLSKLTAPVAFFWAKNDFLAVPEDVARLIPLMKNLFLSYEVPYHKFNHIDFVLAIDAKKLIYDKFMEVLGNQCML